jgi:hypothetical protein
MNNGERRERERESGERRESGELAAFWRGRKSRDCFSVCILVANKMMHSDREEKEEMRIYSSFTLILPCPVQCNECLFFLSCRHLPEK